MKTPLLNRVAAVVLSLALAVPAGTAYAGGGGIKQWRKHPPGVGSVQHGSGISRWSPKGQKYGRGGYYRGGRYRDDYYRGGYYRGGYYRGYNNNGAWVAGALGLAAGAIIGSTLAQPRYYAPAPTRVYYQPWTPEWYSYCSRKYRSFNPRTGYYTAYSGYQRFCR